VAVWPCGRVVVWLCGRVAVWPCGLIVAILLLLPAKTPKSSRSWQIPSRKRLLASMCSHVVRRTGQTNKGAATHHVIAVVHKQAVEHL